MSTTSHRRLTYLPSALLVSLEAVLFLSAPAIAATLYVKASHFTGVEMSTGMILSVAVMYAAASLASMFALRLYTARRSSVPGLILRIGLALLMAMFASIQLCEFIPGLAAGSAFLAAATGIAFLASAAIRITFDCIRDHESPPRVIVVLGAGRRATEIARLRRRADRQWFTVVGYVVTASDQPNGVPAGLRMNVRGDLLAYCEQQNVEEIVVAMDDHRHGFPLDQVNKCRDAGIVVTGYGAFLERETGGIRLDALEPSARAHSRPPRQPAVHAIHITQR